MAHSQKQTTKEPSIKEFRHKAERPLIILGFCLTIFIILLCFFLIADGIENELEDSDFMIISGLFFPFVGFFFIKFNFHQKLKNGIIVSNKQLPEVYQIYKELALKMGFSEEKGKNQFPPLCVINGFGIKHFFTTICSTYEHYIILPSDIVNTIYDEEGNGDELTFALAHKLAHIKCGHRKLRILFIEPLMTITFLNRFLNKAQEFTADRVACYYCPNESISMIHSHLEQNINNRINKEQYFDSIFNYEKSWYSKFVSIMSKCVGYRRTKAIHDSQKHGWDIHGKIL